MHRLPPGCYVGISVTDGTLVVCLLAKRGVRVSETDNMLVLCLFASPRRLVGDALALLSPPTHRVAASVWDPRQA